MKRYKILHQTRYDFSGPVTLYPHTLRLRPREGHELRIESSKLDITPSASLRWQRDVESNSVATATFTQDTEQLSINSEIIIQQYNQAPLDFLVADYAINYPFNYQPEDLATLAPYMNPVTETGGGSLEHWVAEIWQADESIQTYSLLVRLNDRIHQMLNYQRREEEGVQTPEQTLQSLSGSCRDYASLFMVAAQRLGFAARFVSGYLYVPNLTTPGATHAWAEVFIPGAGWKGFDPTSGDIVGPQHIAVAVARLPDSVPPIAGAFNGLPGANMLVDVWVTELVNNDKG